MEKQRLLVAICNSFARILLALGAILMLTPADRFSPAYNVMFSLQPKDVWAVFYALAGSISFVAIYQGSWKIYRSSIYVCLFAYCVLTSIFFSVFLSGGSAPVGAILYGNITLSCFAYSLGYPVFGPFACAPPLSSLSIRQAALTVCSNQFVRILVCYGLALLFTPIDLFSEAYNVLFAVAPKEVWAIGFGSLGVVGAIVLAADKIKQYKQIVLGFAAAFALQAALIGLGAKTATGAALYLNLAIDCLLYHFDKPIYGFVSCAPPSENSVHPPGGSDATIDSHSLR